MKLWEQHYSLFFCLSIFGICSQNVKAGEITELVGFYGKKDAICTTQPYKINGPELPKKRFSWMATHRKIFGGNQTIFFGYGIVTIEMFERKMFQIMSG